MGVITYTALRSLATGHSASTEYQLETAFQQLDAENREKGTLIETLDGSTEYDFDNLTGFIALTTDIVLHDDLEFWEEFFDSVAGRESFFVDLTGTIASPGTDISVQLHRGGYRPQRDGNLTYKFAFEVRKL